MSDTQIILSILGVVGILIAPELLKAIWQSLTE